MMKTHQKNPSKPIKKTHQKDGFSCWVALERFERPNSHHILKLAFTTTLTPFTTSSLLPYSISCLMMVSLMKLDNNADEMPMPMPMPTTTTTKSHTCDLQEI
jgi:hypothetical protein